MARIIIIEDEGSLIEVYGEVLEAEGHEVLKALDGESGLELANSTDWDVMFLDIMLPRLDGVEILKKLKQKFNLNDKPVVMLTNLDNPEVVEECMREGAKEYLSKADINPQVVLTTVKKYVTQQDDEGNDDSAAVPTHEDN